MYKEVTCAQADLRDASEAPALIDEALRQCLLQSRPVYIELPMNMVKTKVSSSRLVEPICISPTPNDELVENAAVDDILRVMQAAEQPAIIVDGWTATYGVTEETDILVRGTRFPTFSTVFGKSIVQENYPNYYGVYAGHSGEPAMMAWVQNCDLVIRMAPLYSDYNTFFFTAVTKPTVTVDIHGDAVSVCGQNEYKNLHIKSLLIKLLARLDNTTITDIYGHSKILKNPPPKNHDSTIKISAEGGRMTQAVFWKRVSQYFQSGDIILAETGTAGVGALDFILPPLTKLITSSIWLSIGYMLGACQGVAMAKHDMRHGFSSSRLSGRTILFEGDGSLQMTVQAISDIIRNRLDVTIFVINNDGYTIERVIHGMTEDYNWIQPWQYCEAARFFGAPKNDPAYHIFAKRAATWAELADVLDDEHMRSGKGLNIVEVILHKEDAPVPMKRSFERQNSGNHQKAKSK